MFHQILGSLIPILELDLEPGESVMARSGELAWITPCIKVLAARVGEDPALPALVADSLGMTAYKAIGGRGLVAFAARLPGQVLQLEVDEEHPYYVHGHGFICGQPGVWLSTGFTSQAAAAGGDDFVLRHLSGRGIGFVELHGEVTVRDLRAGSLVAVRPGHIGLLEGSVQIGEEILVGGQSEPLVQGGTKLVTLKGPGRIWLQSLTLPYLAEALGIAQHKAGHQGGLSPEDPTTPAAPETLGEPAQPG
ncbi:MAG TPA: AIM24 family protein [Candidatus Dormibacteraeota bacterium]|jgi:uncharacterized protein (AIM24 family)|nr:AIM24 family protein [Candidatus Dormibacteraeota bacterium]